jgi:hypothetical protein
LIFDNGTSTGLMKKVVDGDVDGILGFYSFQHIATILLGKTKTY